MLVRQGLGSLEFYDTEESAAYATPKAAEASPSPLQKGRGLGRGVTRCRLSRGLGSKPVIREQVGMLIPDERPILVIHFEWMLLLHIQSQLPGPMASAIS